MLLGVWVSAVSRKKDPEIFSLVRGGLKEYVPAFGLN